MIRHSLTEQAGVPKQDLNPVYSLMGFLVYSTPAHHPQAYNMRVFFYTVHFEHKAETNCISYLPPEANKKKKEEVGDTCNVAKVTEIGRR